MIGRSDYSLIALPIVELRNQDKVGKKTALFTRGKGIVHAVSSQEITAYCRNSARGITFYRYDRPG